jgi:hypothetical protein
MIHMFTFKFTEKQLSILGDALDSVIANQIVSPYFGTEDYAEMSEIIEGRLRW